MGFDRIKEYPTLIINVFKRFPLPIFFAALTAIISITENIYLGSLSKPFDKGLYVWEWLFIFPLGAMGASFAVALLFENSPNKARSIPMQALSCLAWAALSTTLVYCYGAEAGSSALSVWFACLTTLYAAPIILPFLKRKDDTDLSRFLAALNKNTTIALSASLALCGLLCGLLLCIFNLFNIREPNGDIYLNILYFSLFFLAPLLTFSALPRIDELEPDENQEQGKIRTAISKYILPIIVSVFLLIMYAHIVKALIYSFQKSGDITCFASAALSAVICLAILQFPKRTKIFPIASIPLLIIFAVDSVRVALTSHNQPTNLYFVLYCLWCTISVIVILRIPMRCLRWMIISFCAILVIGSIGPLRVFNIAKHIPPKELMEDELDNIFGEKVKDDIPKQKHNDKSANFSMRWEMVDVPPEFSKVMYANLFFFNKPTVTVENGILSFPINKYGQNGKQIARFEVPIQTLLENDNVSASKPIVLKNDSAIYAIIDFSFRQDDNLFFSSKGLAFFKKEPNVPDDEKSE